MALFDFIYVDLEKVISVYSQMTGGIVEVRESNNENSHSFDNKRNYNFKVFRHDAGGTKFEKKGVREVIKPHHALLTEMEEELAAQGYLVDLTKPEVEVSFRDLEFRNKLKDTFCLKVSGRAVIEDYERLKSIGNVFPDIIKLINKSTETSLWASPAFIEAQKELLQLEKQVKSTKERTERLKAETRLNLVKEKISEQISTAAGVGAVDQWILDGMKTWINAFLPGIVNLRVYPYTDRPDEHIIGHLKKQCFEDPDSSSFHFTYGSFPTECITMIGIVTSVPEKDGESFNPLAEFGGGDLVPQEVVESGFRGIFRGFDGMEQLIRTCRFPRVLVHPLTVYRSVRSSKSPY